MGCMIVNDGTWSMEHTIWAETIDTVPKSNEENFASDEISDSRIVSIFLAKFVTHLFMAILCDFSSGSAFGSIWKGEKRKPKLELKVKNKDRFAQNCFSKLCHNFLGSWRFVIILNERRFSHLVRFHSATVYKYSSSFDI